MKHVISYVTTVTLLTYISLFGWHTVQAIKDVIYMLKCCAIKNVVCLHQMSHTI